MKDSNAAAALPADASEDVTELLLRYRTGDDEAFARLVPLVEVEMHRLAAKYLRAERPDHTLQATALVNEAFVTLMGQRAKEWENRGHFMAVAALAMRQVLTSYARKRLAEKRGGRESRVTFDERVHGTEKEGVDILALDNALGELAKASPRQARIVELRYFGGLSIEETARVVELSERTVKREWTVARAWLFAKLRGSPDAES